MNRIKPTSPDSSFYTKPPLPVAVTSFSGLEGSYGPALRYESAEGCKMASNRIPTVTLDWTVGPLAGNCFKAALFSLVLRLPPLSRLLLLRDFWALPGVGLPSASHTHAQPAMITSRITRLQGSGGMCQDLPAPRWEGGVYCVTTAFSVCTDAHIAPLHTH